MKIKLLLLFLIIIGARLEAQIPLDASVTVFEPYPTTYGDWFGQRNGLMVSVVNNSDASFNYFVSIQLQNITTGFYIKIADEYRPPDGFTIGPYSVATLTFDDLEPKYQNLYPDFVESSDPIPGDPVSALTTALPEGEYQLCVELISLNNANEKIYLNPLTCSEPFAVTEGDVTLIFPFNETEVPSEAPVQFQWNVNLSDASMIQELTYDLKIIELDDLIAEEESLIEIFETGSLPVFWQESGLTQQTFMYDVNLGLPAMQPGRTYACRVHATGGAGRPILNNEGYSNIHTFTYGISDDSFAGDGTDGTAEDERRLNCLAKCHPETPEDTEVSDPEYYAVMHSAFQMGNFIIDYVDYDAIVAGAGRSGTGEVSLDFLNIRMRVRFQNVLLNEAGQAISGTVRGIEGTHGLNIFTWLGTSLASGLPISQERIDNIISAIYSAQVVMDVAAGLPVSLPFGARQQIGGQNFSLAIVGFELSVNHSDIDIISIFDFPSLGENSSLALAATDVCVSPEGFGGEYIINLQEDITIPLDGGMTLHFAGGVPSGSETFSLENQIPCHLEMDCDGFKSFALSGRIDVPNSVLLKEGEDGEIIPGEQVRMAFSANYERRPDDVAVALNGTDELPKTDFIAGIQMDPFQIKGLSGWGFELEEGVLDLSSQDNPEGLVFPEGHTFEQEIQPLLWNGFFLKRLKFKSPKHYNQAGERSYADATNIIFDAGGTLSADFTASDPLPFDRGSFKGWAMSIDGIDLKITQNHFNFARMYGKFGTPVFSPDEYLLYHAAIDESQIAESDISLQEAGFNYDLTAVVIPNDNIEIPMSQAMATICNSSYLAMSFSPVEEERQVEVFLKGGLDVNIGAELESIGGQSSFNLADYQLKYNSIRGFLFEEDVNDGTGTYFGSNATGAVNCQELDLSNMQNLFTELAAEASQYGEDVFRDIGYFSETEVVESDPANIDVNALVTFSGSRLEVYNGVPKLTFDVRVNPSSLEAFQAGIEITATKMESGERYHFGVEEVDVYYHSGEVNLISPVDGADVATDEALTFTWEAGFDEQDGSDRYAYAVRVALLNEDENLADVRTRLISQQGLLFEVSDITNLEYILQTTDQNFGQLQTNQRYAAIIQATDNTGEALVDDGFSNVSIFHWGQSTADLVQSTSACGDRCAPPLPQNTSPHVNPSGVSQFMMGNFLVHEVHVDQQSGELINGTGQVTLDFLNQVKVNVSFTNVQLNSESEALAGEVDGIEESNFLQILGDVADYLAGDNADGTVLQNLSEGIQLGRMVHQIATGGTIGIPFGIDLNMGGNSITMAITDFHITPTSNDLDFVQIFSFPSLGAEATFGVGASDICVAPDGPGVEMILSIPSNIDIPIDGDLVLSLTGGLVTGNTIVGLPQAEQSALPTCIQIDCNGFKAINISGNVSFPENVLLKEVQGEVALGEQVRAYFNLNYEREGEQNTFQDGQGGSNLMLGLTMDDFQIPGLDGWGFTVQEATLDLSSTENPAGIEFHEDFTFDIPGMEDAWQGFHLKELSIRPPSQFMSDPSQRTSIGIQHLLIDPTLSVNFVANNILPFSQGNIKGWGMSIDEFALSIVQNNFVDGHMYGQFGAPIFQKAGDNLDTEQFLAYEATVSRQDQDDNADPFYQFDAVVRPQQDETLDLPILGASATLCASSYLGVQIAPGEENTHMEVFLKGNLGIDVGEFLGADAGEFKIPAADFQMKYNTVKGFVMQEEDPNGTTIGVGLLSSDGCTVETFDSSYFNQLFDDLKNDFASGGDQTNRSYGSQGSQVDVADNSEDSEPMADENRMNGFPIRLGNFGISLENGAPALSFTVDLSLASGSDGFAAGAGLTLYTEFTEGDNGKIGFKLDRLGFDCARLACDLQMFKMVGALCYVNDEENDERGYYGRIIADVNGQLTLDLSAGFGTFGSPGEEGHAFGTEEYHAGWYADARIEMESGIQMGPIVLNAIGGGIYWNFIPPDLPGHSSLSGIEGEDSGTPDVNGIIQELSGEYGISLPASASASLGGSPQHDYGRRALKFNAGLSIIRPQLVAIDPSAYVVWTEGEGIDMISLGGYVYVLQPSYLGRGAPSQPATSNGDTDISFDIASAQEGVGSRLWLSGFITLYFDRESSDNTLVAFESSGEVFLNMIPNILYGNMRNQPYKLIDQDILIAHKDHFVVSQRNVDISRISGSTYWHAYFGNPYDPSVGPGAAAFDLMGAIGGGEEVNGSAGIEATAYFMMGNGIPTELPPIPDDIQRIIDGGSSAGDEDNEGSFSGSVNEDAERNGSTTSGLAFGSTVSINLGFEKIIYANLDVTVGGDILLIDAKDMRCDVDGKTYDPPGVEGFYGMGQVFAGLEGSLGIRGKIGPLPVDVKFLELGAGMMLQMGGPNPFWVDGRAGVYYNILGGLIQGDAQVEVTAGDRCVPYYSGGFNLELVDRFYPDENYDRTNAADPNVHPKVTFTMPVTTPNRPEDAETTLPTVSPTGETYLVTFAPVIEEFTLEPTVNNPLETSGSWELSENRKRLKYTPNAPLAGPDYDEEPKRWKMNLRLKVKEKVNGSWRYMEDFEQDTTVRFWTNPLDPYIENVTYTNPIKGQRFFMKNEWSTTNLGGTQLNIIGQKDGVVRFNQNIKDQRFYEVDDTDRECSYYVVVRTASDMQEVSRHLISQSDIYNRRVEFPLPSGLQPDTYYILQLVRQKERSYLDFLGSVGTIRIDFQGVSDNISNEYNVYNNYTIEYEQEAVNPYTEVQSDETLLHMVLFGTSEFANIQDKMANVNLEHISMAEGCTTYSCPAYDELVFSNFDEKFEQIEIDGLTTTLRDDDGRLIGNYFTAPRLRIVDPLEGELFDGVKPLMNNLLSELQEEAYFCPYLYLSSLCTYGEHSREIDMSTHNSNILTPLWISEMSISFGGQPTSTNTIFMIQSMSFADNEVGFRYDVRKQLFDDVDNLLDIAENYSDAFTTTMYYFTLGGGSGGTTQINTSFGNAYYALLDWRNQHTTYFFTYFNGTYSSPPGDNIQYDPNHINVIYNTSPVHNGSTTTNQGNTSTLTIDN